MENNTCVYKHIRLDTNEVFYIGIGNKQRPYKKSIRSIFWKNIVSKTDYIVEIISENIDWSSACELEELLIKEYGRRDLGLGSLVNMTNGGEGTNGYIMPEERKQFLKDTKTGIKFSKETCIKISESRKGMKFSESHKENLRKNIGNKVIDTSTGIIYDSIKEVSRLFPISSMSLYRYLNGKRNNKTTFEYYEIK